MVKEEDWPVWKVERRRLDDLKDHERNSKTHTDEQIKDIAASMLEWGWTIAMLVDEDDVILAGHARRRSAKLNGWTHGPVIVAAGWTDAQKRAYIIADNKLTENGGWNRELMAAEYLMLQEAQFNTSLLGLSQKETDRLLREASNSAEKQLGASRYEIIVTCKDEVEQANLLESFAASGITCKALLS